jgi:serine protease Do
MNRKNRIVCVLAAATLGIIGGLRTYTAVGQSAADSTTQPSPAAQTIAITSPGLFARELYDQKRSSLVAVKYSWESELRKQDLTAAGIVVSEDGLVMFPIAMVTPQMVPNEQMKDFKIIVPSDTQDETEIDATLEGRDERTSVAFVRAKEPQKWKAIKFVEAPVEVGDMIYSVGMLPKGAGYKAHVTTAIMSARLRGPVPQILVDGDLAGVGAPVFDSKGQAIGYVHPRSITEALLDNPDNPDAMPMIDNPSKMFIPTSDFMQSLESPPVADKPIAMPWLGCVRLKGLPKELAEFYDLKNVPAVQIGDVVKDSPADKAGLKTLDLIVKINGQPLERGDMPEELPEILNRKLQRMSPGDTVTLNVIHQKGEPAKDVKVVLAERPKQPQDAHRYYAKDLGFVARDVVFIDRYLRKLPPSSTGVVIALLRPQAAAQAAKLQVNDLVTQMNGKPVEDLDQFKADYVQFRKDKPHDAVVLEVSQLPDKQQTINIEPPQSGAVPGGGDFNQ